MIRRPRAVELAVLGGVLLVCLPLAARVVSLRPGHGAGASPARAARPARGMGLYVFPPEAARLREVSVTIAPERLAALDAGIPKGEWCSRAVRLKSVPVVRVELDGRPVPGRFEARYRGYCDPHWGFRQKSLKIEAMEGAPLWGYKTLNLNALSSDPFLFEVWAAHLLYRAGVPASRAGLVRLTINGRYDGLRELVENIDGEMLVSQGLRRGVLYRERTSLALGAPLAPGQALRDLWKRNSGGSGSWADLERFNSAVGAAVRSGGDGFLRWLDADRYVEYAAAQTIAGTTNLTDHNIPLYRPRGSARFLPVGYDFTAPAQGSHGELFEALQQPYMSLNHLSQLFWSHPGRRRRVHARVAALLEEFPGLFGWYEALLEGVRPALAADLAAGLVADNLPGPPRSWAAYQRANFVRRRLRARLAWLRRAYLDPAAYASAGWRQAAAPQLAIDGAGAYEVLLEPAPGPCRPGQRVRARVHSGVPVDAVVCRGGRAEAVPFIAERNDILPPRPDSPNFRMKNTLGVILVDLENPDRLTLAGARLRSLQTGREVPFRGDWPFLIRAREGGRVGLGRPGLPYRRDLGSADGYALMRLPAQAAFSFDPAAAVLTFESDLPPPERFEEFGPVLCARLGGRGLCHEFGPAWWPGHAAARSKASAGAPAGARVLEPDALRGSGRFLVSAGRWYVPRSVNGSAGMTVRFESGAELLFAEGASLVLRGPVVFPAEEPRAVFAPAGRSWGGLVIAAGGRPCRVGQAEFRGSAEFRLQGRRYTAALTLDGPGGCVVEDAVFADVAADDGLNVKGGTVAVRRSLFLRGRDAMDFDDARALVEDSLVLDAADDGLDLGGSTEATLRASAILGAGDKGLSVGEGARARAEGNVLERCNMTVGVKERSRAELSRNLIGAGQRAPFTYRSSLARPGDPDGVLEVSAPAGETERARLLKRLALRCRACRPHLEGKAR